MTQERTDQIIALGRQPISDAEPASQSVRYEPEFEQLQAQMDRLNSLTGEVVDWRKVVELGTQILREKSKDLMVASYLALGLFETEGYAGLHAALQMYRDLVKTFWEKCHPGLKPPQARASAVQYLADKVVALTELKDGRAARHPEAAEKKAVHDCAAAVIQLDEALNAAFTGQPRTPDTGPLLRALRALKEKVGPLTEPAAAAPAAGGPTVAAAAAAAAAGPSAGAGAIPESFATPEAAVQAVVRVAKYLFTQDQKDPRSYRLARAARLGAIRELPPDRKIPAPPKPRRDFFEKEATGGNWANLLLEAEGQFAVTPLWLDLQRYVALALGGLGSDYAAAADGVILEAVALHQRLPALFERTFADGSPFADGATRAWVADKAGGMGGGGGGSGGSASNGDPVGAAMAEARKLLSQARGEDAVKRLGALLESSGSRRQRFRAQLALAGLAVDLNKLALATGLLEGLERLIDAYQLEEWEPELAARATESLYECLRKARPRPTPDDQTRLNQVFARLSRLDPAAALRLDAPAAAGPGK